MSVQALDEIDPTRSWISRNPERGILIGHLKNTSIPVCASFHSIKKRKPMGIFQGEDGVWRKLTTPQLADYVDLLPEVLAKDLSKCKTLMDNLRVEKTKQVSNY